jgi:hypothetical protein
MDMVSRVKRVENELARWTVPRCAIVVVVLDQGGYRYRHRHPSFLSSRLSQPYTPTLVGSHSLSSIVSIVAIVNCLPLGDIDVTS